MAILNKLYPLILLPLLSACEEIFMPDMPSEPVLCVNSMITAGKPIDISISKSRLYTDSPEKSIVTDAEVSIYANGVLQDDSYIAREGDFIKIVAESPAAGRGEAEVTVPKAIPTPTASWEIINFECHEMENNTVYGQFKLKVDLKIDDPEGDNYYKLSFNNLAPAGEDPGLYEAIEYYGSVFGGLLYNMEPIFSEHISIFESVMGSEAIGFALFTDRRFAGKSYTLRLLFDDCRFYLPKDKLYFNANLIVHSVSPSYYNWANYTWQRDLGSMEDFSDYGFGDPIWGYSNVSSGAGVVAAQAESVCAIDLTEYIKVKVSAL